MHRPSGPRTALRLSVAAWQLSRAPETRSALLGAPAQPELPPFAPPGALAESSVLSSDGRTLISTEANEVTLWDLRTRRVSATYRPPFDEDASALGRQVSPDGRLLALCTPGGARLWDLRADPAWTVRPSCAAEGVPWFTPGGRAPAIQDGHGLRRVDVSSGKELPRLEQTAPVDFVFSPDGRFAAGVGSGDVLLWRLDRPHGPVFRHPVAEEVRIDTQTRVLRYTTGSPQGTRTVRGLDVSRALDSSWQERTATQAVHSADGRVAVVRAGRVSLLDGRTGRRLATVPVAPTGGTSVDSPVLMSLSADGRLLAFGRGTADVLGGPTRITVWDTTRNRSLMDIAVPSEDMAFTGLALSPDGRTLMTMDDSGGASTVRDAADGTKLRVLNRGKNEGADGDDGARAAVSSDGGTVLTDTGALVRTTGNGHERTALENCACRTVFSPAGDRAAVIGSRTGITVWDGRLRTPLGLLSGGLSKGMPGRYVRHAAGRASPSRHTTSTRRGRSPRCAAAPEGRSRPPSGGRTCPASPTGRCAERRPRDRPARPAARRAGRRPRRRRGGPAQNASRPGDEGVVRGHARRPGAAGALPPGQAGAGAPGAAGDRRASRAASACSVRTQVRGGAMPSISPNRCPFPAVRGGPAGIHRVLRR
ncbi:WD40 repeat domain-containing protein [Streptomyces sp. TLI_105]|uniref:WD40 repeat domain-containing protein n=1 Tax=Streptomyces sp. TLI_105 TaxID=1881019 RepID=UPI00089B4A77|nr:hypothetical protein [Streptomyces sp. TLI_105]SEB88303.1 WD40 repeat [Streptomyces sp. TLI_105]